MRHIPKPVGVFGIKGIGGIAARQVGRPLREQFRLVAVLEIPSANAFEQRRRGEQDAGRRALFGRFATLNRRFQATGVLLQPGRDGRG